MNVGLISYIMSFIIKFFLDKNANKTAQQTNNNWNFKRWQILFWPELEYQMIKSLFLLGPYLYFLRF